MDADEIHRTGWPKTATPDISENLIPTTQMRWLERGVPSDRYDGTMGTEHVLQQAFIGAHNKTIWRDIPVVKLGDG